MSKIALALDISDPKQAQKLITLLEPHVGAFKVGLEYFIANGNIPETTKPIILDLKLYDIPTTVSRAVKAACERSERIRYITMHIQQRDTISWAVGQAEQFGVTMLGVTVLTSMSLQDIAEVEQVKFDILKPMTDTMLRHVAMKATHGDACGLSGFVCSPQEVKWMRNRFKDAFLLVPGVRSGSSKTNDQRRTSTPSQAVADGASMIVVGRPIYLAKDPVAVAKQINAEIEGVPQSMPWFKVQAVSLQGGDEFSTDEGETWYRVARASASPDKRTVVVARKLRGVGHAADDTSTAQEFWFGNEQEVTTHK